MSGEKFQTLWRGEAPQMLSSSVPLVGIDSIVILSWVVEALQ
jgi:hypothetical protein